MQKNRLHYGLSKCDVLKISDNEIQWFTGEEDFDAGIAKLREQYNIPLIMLSLGRDGSRAYYKDLRVEVKPFLQDSTIETTGAGRHLRRLLPALCPEIRSGQPG